MYSLTFLLKLTSIKHKIILREKFVIHKRLINLHYFSDCILAWEYKFGWFLSHTKFSMNQTLHMTNWFSPNSVYWIEIILHGCIILATIFSCNDHTNIMKTKTTLLSSATIYTHFLYPIPPRKIVSAYYLQYVFLNVLMLLFDFHVKMFTILASN